MFMDHTNHFDDAEAFGMPDGGTVFTNDLDGDGDFESIGSDFDGDGVLDIQQVDTDGDGSLESVAFPSLEGR